MSPPIWQRKYYKHIIRNEKEYQDIWKYNEANPGNWIDDQLNPISVANINPQDWRILP
jgi:hypothetical protein